MMVVVTRGFVEMISILHYRGAPVEFDDRVFSPFTEAEISDRVASFDVRVFDLLEDQFSHVLDVFLKLFHLSLLLQFCFHLALSFILCGALLLTQITSSLLFAESLGRHELLQR